MSTTVRYPKTSIIHETCELNHVIIGSNSKLSKRIIAFGNKENPLVIGDYSYVGIGCILQGYSAPIKIGNHTSIAMTCHFLTDSGPNCSEHLQTVYPIESGPIIVGNHCWICDSVLILPNVTIGDYCIIGAKSVVKSSVPPFSVVAGNPAKIIKKLPQTISSLKSI